MYVGNVILKRFVVENANLYLRIKIHYFELIKLILE